jgi:hypothetical protein
MDLFESPPYWYAAIALVVSFYQGARGFIFQNQFGHFQRKKPDGFAPAVQTDRQLWLLRALADGIFYFVTTFTGFAALLLVCRFLNREPFPIDISGGAAALLVFLILYGVLVSPANCRICYNRASSRRKPPKITARTPSPGPARAPVWRLETKAPGWRGWPSASFFE